LGQRLVPLDGDLPELLTFFGDPKALAAYLAIEDKLLLEGIAELARQRLTPRELEVFELRLSGLALEEIATMQGITSGAVRKQWHDIRHKLVA
jgi:DNA-binding CsgD family transcriptional regulator